MNLREDTYYIKQVLSGNINAYKQIVDMHKDHSYNLAFRICGNREDAEEVLQDSFLKAFNSLKNFKMKSSFATWFYRIVYNTSVSLVRQRKHAPVLLDDFPAEYADFNWSVSSQEEIDAEYNSALVNFALQKLSYEDRGLIVLYYFDEMSTDEISAITGINKSNVKVRLFRLRHNLLKFIKEADKKNLIYNERFD
jgi:RNA polymerase sigma factor (sigma-70 family)